MATVVGRALVIAGAAVALAATAAPAAADPPEITRYTAEEYSLEVQWPNDDPDAGWAAERCDFPVHYQDYGKGFEIVFADRILAGAPGLHATITNMDTGTSLSLPVNGSMTVSEAGAATPGHVVETLTFRGPSINVTPGQLTWFTGRRVVVSEYDESGELVSGPRVTQRGRVLDVCAALGE